MTGTRSSRRTALLLAGVVAVTIAAASANAAAPKTTVSDPPPVTILAKITHLKISPHRFRVGSKDADIARSSRTKKEGGATLTFTLNGEGHLIVRVYQLLTGRKHGNVCVPGRKAGAPCKIYEFHHGTDHYEGVKGANTVTFSGRLAGSKLKPGRYKLVLTPYKDDKTGKPASVRFTIIR
jgi:hypothetical protein